jgi:flagellar basal-body rod modification protein FlgD
MFMDGITSATSSSAPATTQSATDKQQLNETLNRFLTLLVTQLQHQDPLQPMDANEFTQQLVQFASVEQQIYQNDHLEKLLELQKGTHAGNLINYLGSAVEVEGSTLTLEDGGTAASYTLAEAATRTEITITDADGVAVVRRLGETAAGTHGFTWDGQSDNGEQLPDGVYGLTVTATRRDGQAVATTTRVFARVTGIANDGDEPELMIGEERVPVAKVLSVNANIPGPAPSESE